MAISSRGSETSRFGLETKTTRLRSRASLSLIKQQSHAMYHWRGLLAVQKRPFDYRRRGKHHNCERFQKRLRILSRKPDLLMASVNRQHLPGFNDQPINFQTEKNENNVTPSLFVFWWKDSTSATFPETVSLLLDKTLNSINRGFFLQ